MLKTMEENIAQLTMAVRQVQGKRDKKKSSYGISYAEAVKRMSLQSEKSKRSIISSAKTVSCEGCAKIKERYFAHRQE